MTYSELQITFNDDMTLWSRVEFDVTDTTTNQTSTIVESWRHSRHQAYFVALPVSGDTVPKNERSAINFVASFNADYNRLGIYEVTRNGIVVTIKAKTPNISFSNPVIVSWCRKLH